jgi:hypothetical protein
VHLQGLLLMYGPVGMVKHDELVVSRGMYAVRPDTLSSAASWRRLDAVWFRRRHRQTVACVGYLWGYSGGETVGEFLEGIDTARYGGTCLSRWDGRIHWSNGLPPEEMGRQLAILRPMLESYPAIPEGYDGWWEFRK